MESENLLLWLFLLSSSKNTEHRRKKTKTLNTGALCRIDYIISTKWWASVIPVFLLASSTLNSRLQNFLAVTHRGLGRRSHHSGAAAPGAWLQAGGLMPSDRKAYLRNPPAMWMKSSWPWPLLLALLKRRGPAQHRIRPDSLKRQKGLVTRSQLRTNILQK